VESEAVAAETPWTPWSLRLNGLSYSPGWWIYLA